MTRLRKPIGIQLLAQSGLVWGAMAIFIGLFAWVAWTSRPEPIELVMQGAIPTADVQKPLSQDLAAENQVADTDG